MATVTVIWNEVQRAEIKAELVLVLAAPPFTNSQRCTSFLRHLVELTLSGEHERIKERTLGIEVFQRDPQYDMNADPIVRRIASDTRKRLTQYYQENPERTVRIRLEVGSYIPQFDFEPDNCAILPLHIDTNSVATTESAIQLPLEVEISPKADPVPPKAKIGRKWIFLGSAVLLVLIACFAIAQVDYFRSTNYLIWKPLLASKGDLIVCVSDRLPTLFSDALTSAEAKMANKTDLAPESASVNITAASVNITAASRPRPKFIDMMTAFKIAKQLDHFGRNATLIPASSLNTRNLSNGPIILVGSINYPLSMLLQSKLRYTFRLDHGIDGRWIEDAQNPANHAWRVDGAPENAKVDYGMVTRFWDSDTGGWVLMVCGIGPFGTEAAASLVTDPVPSQLIPAAVRSAPNFQIVVKTTVIDGSAGAPQILAVQTW